MNKESTLIEANGDRQAILMRSPKSNRLKFRALRLGLAGLAMLFAAGCSLMLEPIEHNFLFRPWSADSAQLALVAARGNGIEEVRIKTPDGVTLHGWLKHPETARVGERFPLVIVFGGVRRETSWMIDRADHPANWGWLFINYRGFGLSEGEPSERVILSDTRLIFDYAAARPDVDVANIVVLGRSLGSYFTVALANTRRLRGAILATPFDSFTALGKERFPWLPVGVILNGRYDAVTLAPQIKIPALFILADNDEVTPVENGAAVAHAWGGPQRCVTLAGARHYGIEWRDEFWKAIENFLREVESGPQPLNGYVMDAASRPAN